jgi:methylenetetrahydrofolate reductase (NADPH)
VPTPGGFEYAAELVRFIRERHPMSIGVAGFPEGHLACKSGRQADWNHLRAKIDAGADFVLTQLFFDNTDFFTFRDYLAGELGVKVPIIPGIVAILSGSQILARLDELGDDEAAVTDFGIEYATRQCEELLRAGAPGIHFYTLNRAAATTRVLKNLGLRK